MSMRTPSKEEKRIAEEAARREGVATIIDSGKPPEKSRFSNDWRLITGTIASAGALAALAVFVARNKKKNGHQE